MISGAWGMSTVTKIYQDDWCCKIWWQTAGRIALRPLNRCFTISLERSQSKVILLTPRGLDRIDRDQANSKIECWCSFDSRIADCKYCWRRPCLSPPSNLHDWPTPICRSILSHIAGAMTANYSELTIWEVILPDTNVLLNAACTDLRMMLLQAGMGGLSFPSHSSPSYSIWVAWLALGIEKSRDLFHDSLISKETFWLQNRLERTESQWKELLNGVGLELEGFLVCGARWGGCHWRCEESQNLLRGISSKKGENQETMVGFLE